MGTRATGECWSVGLFVSGLSLICASTNSLIFSDFALQITIPKYKEIAGHFYPLLQWAKRHNRSQSPVFGVAVLYPTGSEI